MGPGPAPATGSASSTTDLFNMDDIVRGRELFNKDDIVAPRRTEPSSRSGRSISIGASGSGSGSGSSAAAEAAQHRSAPNSAERDRIQDRGRGFDDRYCDREYVDRSRFEPAHHRYSP